MMVLLHQHVVGVTACSAWKIGWRACDCLLFFSGTDVLVTLEKLRAMSTANVTLVLSTCRDVGMTWSEGRAATERLCGPAAPLTGPSNVLLLKQHLCVLMGGVCVATNHLGGDGGALEACVNDDLPVEAFMARHPNVGGTLLHLVVEVRRVRGMLRYHAESPAGDVLPLPPASAIPSRWLRNTDWRRIANDTTIVSVASGACTNMPRLSTLSLHSVAHIGASAFWMSGLTAVSFAGAPLREIGECAFLGCSRLREVEFNTGLEVIGASAFMNSGLQSVVLPPTVMEMGASAFRGTPLRSAAVDCNVSAHAFASCRELRCVTLGPTVCKIGNAGFASCVVLAKINLETIGVIGHAAFRGCALAGTLSIHGAVGRHAFAHNRQLTLVHLGKHAQIMPKAFAGCTRLHAVLGRTPAPPSETPTGWAWPLLSPFPGCNQLLCWRDNGVGVRHACGPTTAFVPTTGLGAWLAVRPHRGYVRAVQRLLADRMGVGPNNCAVRTILTHLWDADMPAPPVERVTAQSLRRAAAAATAADRRVAHSVLASTRVLHATVANECIMVTLEGHIDSPRALAPWLSADVGRVVVVTESVMRSPRGGTLLVVRPTRPPLYGNLHRLAVAVRGALRSASGWHLTCTAALPAPSSATALLPLPVW